MRRTEILLSVFFVACGSSPTVNPDASGPVDAALVVHDDASVIAPNDDAAFVPAADAAIVAHDDAAPVAPDDAALVMNDDASAPGPGPTPVNISRDRLLDTMVDATHATRCDVWTGFDAVQKGVFLTLTDLLGGRSWLTEDPAGPRMGADLDMALDHVERFVAVLGTLNCSRAQCCGGAGHRVFFVADAQLIAALRDTNAGLPMWGSSLDLAGPHDPFTSDSETSIRQPTGQAHFFATDADAVVVVHDGVPMISEPHLVEIDIDYNVIHDSNPVCDYSGGTNGFDRYITDWSAAGAGGAPDFAYLPSGC